MTTQATTATQLDDDILRSWRLQLKAARRSEYTIRNYMDAANHLRAFLQVRGHSLRLTDITRADLEEYQVALMERLAPSTVATRYKNLHALFTWLVEEEEISASPMAKIRKPAFSEPDVPVLTDEEAAALMATCAGSTFKARRDTAVITLLLDSGLRLAELTSLTLESVADLETGAISVLGKGAKWRTVAVGHGAVAALDRYLRMRKSHPWATRSDKLWIGKHGALRARAIGGMVSARGKEAGISVHPHQLRHTWASNMKEAGVQHDELKALGGWSSDAMLQRYGSRLRHRAGP